MRASCALAALLLACHPSSPRPTPSSPPDPLLSFQWRTEQGGALNELVREGAVSAHIVVRSAPRPRLLVAFPAADTGAALWLSGPASLRLREGTRAFERAGLRGVRFLLESEGPLRVEKAVLGSVRIIREVQSGHEVPPGLEALPRVEGSRLSLRRTGLDQVCHELTLEVLGAGRIEEKADAVFLAPARGEPLELAVEAGNSAEPLHPLPLRALVRDPAAHPLRSLQALGFLAYQEKLLAGSWRFLTYFGRDTLIALRLLTPVLEREAIEAGLSAVLERLSPSGEVAHEEDVGELAALRRAREKLPGPTSEPLYDYKMIDGDFLLAPVLAHYLFETPLGARREGELLARRTAGGRTFAAALAANLDRVLALAAPFAASPGPSTLVALRPGVPVGQWRDSAEGLGGGRVPFDVNAALVPAALKAAARLYRLPEMGSREEAAAEAERLSRAWRGAIDLFRLEVPEERARAEVASYARELGLDAADALASLQGKGPLALRALALDAEGHPVPVMHSDDGFVLLFDEPDAAYLEEAAGRILRPFPAGLRTPVGCVVANPVFAPETTRRDFTRSHYAGAVIHSWQQAMLAAGLRRQLGRGDLTPALRSRLQEAEAALWSALEGAGEMRSAELWTWDICEGRIVGVPFGAARSHEDEANALQLWSTVWLAVRPQ